ncbi:hypothetical protein F-liban_52 [Faustovirus]|nr:hypothetical protein F-liban_52 [Faustovirus]SME64721.1 Hypothetical protein FSTVST1_51 [Faustovirus ST1]
MQVVKIPEKFGIATNDRWYREDEELEQEYADTPQIFWNFIRNMGWDEFNYGGKTNRINIPRHNNLQKDVFLKNYGKLIRNFINTRSELVPEIGKCIMLASHFIALGHEQYNTAMNDDEVVKNVFTADLYGDFNGSLPDDWRYIHIFTKPTETV